MSWIQALVALLILAAVSALVRRALRGRARPDSGSSPGRPADWADDVLARARRAAEGTPSGAARRADGRVPPD